MSHLIGGGLAEVPPQAATAEDDLDDDVAEDDLDGDESEGDLDDDTDLLKQMMGESGVDTKT